MENSKTEEWRTFQPGERVRVRADAIGGADRAFTGEVGAFQGYSKPSGYARVIFSGRDAVTLLHPESLQRVEP